MENLFMATGSQCFEATLDPARLALGYLYHSGSAHTGLRGIGVDMEITKPPRLDSAARFLSDGELKWLYLAPQCEQPIALLRLWTVKEAVFKALPDNAGVHFKDILLAAPGELDGEAFIGDGSHRVIVAYTTAPYQCGFISAAVNRPVT
jgi:hypothetical protein